VARQVIARGDRGDASEGGVFGCNGFAPESRDLAGPSVYHNRQNPLRMSQDLPIILGGDRCGGANEKILPRLDEMVDGGLNYTRKSAGNSVPRRQALSLRS